MQINEELRQRIGVAFNEATLLGVEFDKGEKRVACSFALVAMDENGNVPEDNRLLFIFEPIGRFVASYRKGHWDDSNAEVEKFEPEKILEIVQQFQKLSIYGWEFVNCGDKAFDSWKDRLSFDYLTGESSGFTNTIDLFQDGGDKHIDIRIWFDNFEIFNPKYEAVELEVFLENGKRGWDAIYADNDKMSNFGIIPATSESKQKLEKMFSKFNESVEPKSKWTKIKEKLKL
jgi:hypothetical protein